MRKFNVGDKVKIRDNVAQYIELERRRPRTIVDIEYDGNRCMYMLGSNGRGASADGNPIDGYNLRLFRSTELEPWTFRGKMGRPPARQKRRYHFHRPYRRKGT